MTALLITGVVLIGLGAVAWYYVGSDIIRYIRINNM